MSESKACKARGVPKYAATTRVSRNATIGLFTITSFFYAKANLISAGSVKSLEIRLAKSEERSILQYAATTRASRSAAIKLSSEGFVKSLRARLARPEA